MNRKKESSYSFFFKKFIRPHTPTIIILLVLDILGILFGLVTPLLSKYLIDDVFSGKRVELFGYILLGIAGIYLISAISSYFSSYIGGKLNLTLFRDVTGETFETLQFASLKETQKMKIGDMLSRTMSNAHSAIQIFSSILPQFFISVIQIIGPFVIMFFLNNQLTLIVMAPVLLFVLSSAFFGKRIKKRQRKSLDKIASVHSFLKEVLSTLPLVKVFGLEKWSRDKFRGQMDDYYDSSLSVTKTHSLSGSVNSLIHSLPMLLVVGFGGTMAIKGDLTIGTYVAFMGYVGLFFSPISGLSILWTQYKSSSAAFDRVNELFELEQDDKGSEALFLKKGVVKARDVWFSYNGRTIFQGFNATFQNGRNYIVGDNGTGKTTILKLLCNLYPIERGSITIDGQDISKVRRGGLRKNISMVFSEAYLFDVTIYESIHIGNISASEEEVINAAKLARVHDFIMSLPQKYETNVGEAGLRLSSGEKQKIALARAILKDSPIMLLDEVTKSIDAESRRSINETITSLKDKTIIIVTHDMNEIDNGKVIHLG